MATLHTSVTSRPLLTIGGDQVGVTLNLPLLPSFNTRIQFILIYLQLTGKSTLSKKLAEFFQGETISAGVIFRAVAKERGVPVEQLYVI